MPKHRYYYWFDERSDDFANTGINGKPTPEGFEYLPKNIFYRFFKPVVYYALMAVVSIVVWPLSTVRRIHNARVLHSVKDKRKGYFIFGNHTSGFSDALLNPVLAMPRQVYIVASPDSISIPFLRTLLRFLGVMPVPSARSSFMDFKDAIIRHYEKGCAIAIFPEAHIWPKYNKIRDFSDSSFNIPARLGAPCFVRSAVYRKRRNGRTYQELWYDGPFYPRTDLPPKQAQKDLRDRIYAQMCLRCKDSELDSRFHYIKVDSPEQVRSEYRQEGEVSPF